MEQIDKSNLKDIIEISYKIYLEEDKHSSKYNFLSDAIFNFVTYEYKISELMAKEALAVCLAISESNTFELIDTDEKMYLTMVNMPFLQDKIDWGTSIRGAWWSHVIRFKSSFLHDKDGDQILDLTFEDHEWKEFIEVIVDFVS